MFPILLGWDTDVLGTWPLEQGSIEVPSQKVAQMAFLGSIQLGTQEKVTLGDSRRLLILSAGRVTGLRT